MFCARYRLSHHKMWMQRKINPYFSLGTMCKYMASTSRASQRQFYRKLLLLVDIIPKEYKKHTKQLCYDFALIKSTRNQSNCKKISAENPVERVYTDVIGPKKVASVSNLK